MKVIARSSNLLGKITILVVVVLCVNTAMALDGSGTEEDPWLIQSLDDFNDFAADANYWDDYTRLETDVNLAGLIYSTAVIAPDVNDVEYWFQGTAFTGVFDGNNHQIINLTIDDGGVQNNFLGLFGFTTDGDVRDLGLEGGSFSGGSTVGGLVGANGDLNNIGSAISNCYFTGDVNSYSYVGGLVGANLGSISKCYFTGDVKSFAGIAGGLVMDNGGSISNCHSTGSVMSRQTVGGLVGYNVNGGSISNCYSTSSVSIFGPSSNFSFGGLVGVNDYGGSISNCYSTGDVSGNDSVGGLVGYNHYYSSISNCYSIGDVRGNDYVGGLVGGNGHWAVMYYNPGGEISNCYSTGDVIGNDNVGGLVGENYDDGIISNCYSIGDVNGVSNVGGLVGWNGQIGVSNDSFWDTNTQTHGITESIGLNEGTVSNVEGLPTAQMQTKSTFTDAGWDFIDIWLINESATYPVLRQEIRSDLNGDGGVNFLDFGIFANQWMEGVE